MAGNYSPVYASSEVLQFTKPPMGVVHKLTWFVVLLLIFTIPWGNGLWDGMAKILAIAGFGLAVIMLSLSGTHRNYHLFNLMALVLGSWHLVALWWSPDLDWGFQAANTFTQLVLSSFLYTYIISDEYKLRWAYQAYVAGALVAFGIIFVSFLGGVTGPYYNRYTVPNIETDSMAIILSLAIPMAVWLYTQYTHWFPKYMNLISVPAIFYGIFLTGTRTGLVTGMLGVFYWAFTQRKASFHLKMIYVGIALSMAVAVVSLAPKASVDRIFSIGKAIESGDLNSREKIWQFSIESWKEEPVLGGGTGSLGHSLNRFHVEFKSAHNSYIQILTEHGLIGLFVYLLMVATLFYYALQCPVETKIFLITLLVTIAVSQLTLHSHKVKEVWFVWSIVGVHGYYFARKRFGKVNIMR